LVFREKTKVWMRLVLFLECFIIKSQNLFLYETSAGKFCRDN